MATSDSGSDTESTTSSSERMETDEAFPFPSYLQHQEEILKEARRLLFDEGYDTIAIDAPTGIGKSGINIAIGRIAKSAFYTTPQKKLRKQLQQDDDLSPYHSALRSRRDYTCRSAPTDYAREDETYTCESCPVNNSSDLSCMEYNCQYWGAKEDAMDARIATITFAYLIIDGRLPTSTEVMQQAQSGQSKITSSTMEQGSVQISFGDREVLIVDEGHTLAEQVASLHAGNTLGPNTIKTNEVGEYAAESVGDVDDIHPYDVFNDAIQSCLSNKKLRIDDAGVANIIPALKETKDAVEGKAGLLSQHRLTERGGKVMSTLNSIEWKLGTVIEDMDDNRPWVMDGEKLSSGRYRVELKPVWVDRFLQNNVWSRADKVVLSTATLPFRDDPNEWFERLGRDPSSAKVISKPMPFPVENRKIRADYQIDNMSSGGVKDNWDEIVQTIDELSEKHAGEKGLIHTVSYDRAERLHDEFPDKTVLHEQDSTADASSIINYWQHSDSQILLTPSMTEGVDLKGDMCRWQVILKVPYRSLGDPRVDYLLNEEGDWNWYNDVAAREMIQAAGRIVRSEDDYGTTYVFDEAFDRVMSGRTPDWFEEAIVR